VTTVVYTDGACSGNPGPGGWAWAVPDGPFASGAEDHTTNQRMEIAAVLEALRALNGPVEVVSDSTYVVHCFRDRWWEGWLRKGWVNSQKKPVANRDLWEPLIDEVRERGDVTFRWVKGHSGDPMNDLVDALAVDAAARQVGSTGTGAIAAAAAIATGATPTAPAPASASTPQPGELGMVSRAEARETMPSSGEGGVGGGGDALPGHPVAVFGHRPTELGGYDVNPLADAVRARLGEILRAKAILDDDLVVVSGLRLGAEMLGAEAALESGLPLVAVLPYPDPESVWPEASQRRFRSLLDRATEVRLLERKAPDSKQKAGAALGRRDAWLARHAAEAILVWDGEDPSLARLQRSLEDHLGEDVWVLDPHELGAAR